MVEEHPARLASQRSMSCAERKAKAEWLALYTDDAILEDPVGSSPLDPEGKGHQGKEALHVFWDTNIANSGTKFTIKESYTAGNEVANVGRIDLTLADGSTAICDGVFVYKVNDEGKIVSLRTFWEFDKMMATIKSASGS